MSKDPYQVLGIDRNASDEEIKRAYKELARKYHPDKYNNNPLAELAEEKMREINEAYDTLMKGDRKTAGGNSGYGNSGYGGNSYGGSYGQGPFGQGGAYGGGYANSDASIFMQVRACINNGNIAYADSLLSKINNHNAEWYFLKGIVFLRQGRVTEGAEYINRAAQMNPSNQEYARMAQQVNNSNYDFRQTSVNSGYGMGNDMCCASPCGLCETMLCMNLCCNCCN